MPRNMPHPLLCFVRWNGLSPEEVWDGVCFSGRKGFSPEKARDGVRSSDGRAFPRRKRWAGSIYPAERVLRRTNKKSCAGSEKG